MMFKFNFNIEAVTPVGQINFVEENFVAVFAGHIYFISSRKLYKLLSWLKIFFEFNEYITSYKMNDITKWLKSKGILSKEILQEISSHYVPATQKEYSNNVCSFLPQREDIFDKEILCEYFSVLVKNNFKNLLVANYYIKNNKEFNDYIKNLMLFFEKNPKALCYKNNALEFFIKCALEMDKLKLAYKFSCIDKILLHCDFQDDSELFFKIFKLINGFNNIYVEMLKSHVILKFTMNCQPDVLMNIEKYFNFINSVNLLRLETESALLGEHYCSQKYNTNTISSANFSFLSLNQIFYLMLSSQNKQRLNDLFLGKLDINIPYHLFYFLKDDNANLKFINYAAIKF